MHKGLEKRRVKAKQLMRFTTHRERVLFYKARKKVKSRPKINIDLTKKRLILLKEAQQFVSDQEVMYFVMQMLIVNLKFISEIILKSSLSH